MQCMNIKIKRHRSIAQFPNPIHRIQAPGHTNLDHTLPKTTNIGNHINVASPNISMPIIDVINALIDLDKLIFQIRYLVITPRFS